MESCERELCERTSGWKWGFTRWRFMSFWIGSFRPVEDFENADSAWIRAILALNLLTAIGGATGIVMLWRKRSPYVFPAAVFVVSRSAGVLRDACFRCGYRHPIDPIVLLLDGDCSDRCETLPN